jgi:hypothetical protein
MFFFLSVLAPVYHTYLSIPAQVILQVVLEILEWIYNNEYFLGLYNNEYFLGLSLFSLFTYVLCELGTKHIYHHRFNFKKHSCSNNEKTTVSLVSLLIMSPIIAYMNFLMLVVVALNKLNLYLVRLGCACIYYLTLLILMYLYTLCFTSESGILLYIDVLKYFYSSLYLHVLFAYVFVLCSIYTLFTEYYGLVNIVQFIVNIRWSWFFFTKEEVKTNRTKDSHKCT